MPYLSYILSLLSQKSAGVIILSDGLFLAGIDKNAIRKQMLSYIKMFGTDLVLRLCDWNPMITTLYMWVRMRCHPLD